MMRAISPMRNVANDEGEGRNESNGKKCSQEASEDDCHSSGMPCAARKASSHQGWRKI